MAKEQRLIDAYTLAEEIEALRITVAGKPAKWNDAKHSALRVIAEQADVDAAPVVRCRDCKHLVLTEDGEHNPNDCVCDYWMHDGLTDDDFCSYGERRTDNA